VSEAREPVDLRLVPAAVAAWAAAVLVTGVLDEVAVVAVLALVLLVAVVLAWQRRLASAAGGLLLGAGVAMAVLSSGTVHALASERGGLAALVDDGAVVTATGVLRTDTEPAPAAWAPSAPRSRCVMAVTSITDRGATRTVAARLLVTIEGSVEPLVRGTTVLVHGRLSPAGGARQDVSGTVVASTIEATAGAVGVDASVARWRAGLLAATVDLPPQARGLVPGMTLGDTSRVPDDLDRALRDAGLTHLTAVSGTHVSVVVLAVSAAAGAAGASRTLRATAISVALAAFVLLVHPEPSVLRASLMGLVGVGGILLGRPSRALPALAAAVVALLVVDPALVRSIGFALSVVATAAIVVMAVPAARLLSAIPRSLAHAVTVPLAAQSACGPILVLMDPVVSPWAVPANLAAAPAVLPAVLFGLAATAVHPLSPVVAGLLARASGVATGWIATVATTCAGFPGARLEWAPEAPGAIALASFTALGWLLAARSMRAVVRLRAAEGASGGGHRPVEVRALPWTRVVSSARGRLCACLRPTARPPRRL